MATGWGFSQIPGGMTRTEQHKKRQTRNDGQETMGKRMKKTILLVAVLASLAGCNTVAGVGEDVTGGARTVQEMF